MRPSIGADAFFCFSEGWLTWHIRTIWVAKARVSSKLGSTYDDGLTECQHYSWEATCSIACRMRSSNWRRHRLGRFPRRGEAPMVTAPGAGWVVHTVGRLVGRSHRSDALPCPPRPFRRVLCVCVFSVFLAGRRTRGCTWPPSSAHRGHNRGAHIALVPRHRTTDDDRVVAGHPAVHISGMLRGEHLRRRGRGVFHTDSIACPPVEGRVLKTSSESARDKFLKCLLYAARLRCWCAAIQRFCNRVLCIPPWGISAHISCLRRVLHISRYPSFVSEWLKPSGEREGCFSERGREAAMRER